MCGASASAAIPMRSSVVSELAPYCYPNNRAPQTSVTFMPDGQNLIERSDDGKRLVLRDIVSGKEGETLFDVTHTRETQLPSFEGFKLSPDASKILIWTDSKPVYRRSSTAKYYVYEVRSRLLKPLSTEHPRQSVPLFSPDSRMVAFVADNNIYAAKLDYATEVAVTTDGAAGKIINGATDWTYEEEFEITSLMAWAPDNLTLCYVKSDESEVPLYTLPLYQGTCEPMDQYELYPGTLSYKYPVSGQPNSTVTLHSYDVETRKTKEIKFPGGAPYYIPRIGYGPTPANLMVATLNRDQNTYEIFSVNPKSTVARSVYSQKSKAWIEPMAYEDLYFGEKSFVVSSDASGHTRFLEYSYTGSPLREISQAGVDATAYYGSDRLGNHYYQAAAPTPMDRTVYCVNAKGVHTAVSKTAGNSSAKFAPGCEYMSLSFNDINTPVVTDLCRANGKVLRNLADNKAYADKNRGLLADKEFITVRADDGTMLNGYIIKPRDFDPNKRYPVVMSQYSGPGSQQVLNRWSLDWEMYYASKGFIVLCVDGRGTGGRGAAFRTAVYRQLGTLETADQIAAARYAKSLPYVDASRIGIYGWSYGGYEALMCATAQDSPFAAAVAVAPVTDWHFYDTVYTERYMLTPQQNESGYSKGSVLNRASSLACPTLIMYGTLDDNVHPANSLQFISRLESFGILPDMLVFPNMNHSIYGCNARQVVYARMFEYFQKNL